MAVIILKPGLQPLVDLAKQLEGGFTEAQKEELFRRALLSADGKVQLAKTRRQLDHDGSGRILVVDPLPQGALPIYDRDFDAGAIEVKKESKYTMPTRGYYEGIIEEWLRG